MRMTEKESMMQNEKKKRRLTRLVLTGICMAGCLVPMIGLAADTSSENDIRYGLHVTDSDAVNGKIDISFDKDKIINVSSTEGITIALALDNKGSDVSLSSAGDLTLNSTNMTTDLSHSTMGIRENIVNGTTKSTLKVPLPFMQNQIMDLLMAGFEQFWIKMDQKMLNPSTSFREISP